MLFPGTKGLRATAKVSHSEISSFFKIKRPFMDGNKIRERIRVYYSA